MSHEPPMAYAMVAPGPVFRSGLPTRNKCALCLLEKVSRTSLNASLSRARSHAFLERLRLRTMIYLTETESVQPLEKEQASYDEMLAWLDSCGTRLIPCAVPACKEPFLTPDAEHVARALRVIVDPSQHPVLVCSVRGDNPVSLVVGLLRRLQRWSLTSIFDEYRRFSPTPSLLDMQYIELFDLAAVERSSAEEEGPPSAAPV